MHRRSSSSSPPPRLPFFDDTVASRNDESDVFALLAHCPDPLPLAVIARALQIPNATTTLAPLIRANSVSVENDSARLLDTSTATHSHISGALICTALEAILEFLEDRPGPARRDQVLNAITLQETAPLPGASIHVSHTFHLIQSSLKSRGDKRRLLQVARRSISAARLLGARRTDRQVEDEAIALVCGTSWVYQRIGLLGRARLDAEDSQRLGEKIGLEKNTAFCKKCLGRLARLTSAQPVDPAERVALLAKSVSLLSEAIDVFARLGMEAEVGDCYSLLARTCLAQRQLRRARAAIQEAQARLLEPGTKDYLDLQLVRADLVSHHDTCAADAEYTRLLAEADHSDAQTSEIFARVYLSRARARVALGENAKAVDDFRQSAEIWDTLQDPTANQAHWEGTELTAVWLQDNPDATQFLYQQPIDVRVQVARMADEVLLARAAPRANRAPITVEYLRGLVNDARTFLARKRPEW